MKKSKEVSDKVFILCLPKLDVNVNAIPLGFGWCTDKTIHVITSTTTFCLQKQKDGQTEKKT